MACMVDRARPGTKALRVALVGMPVGVALLVIALVIDESTRSTSEAVALLLMLLSLIGFAALAAGLVGLFVGAWRRLA